MITTIIFDWGGVLTKGRFAKAILAHLSKKEGIDPVRAYPAYVKLHKQLNRGTIDFQEFVKKVNKKLGIGFSAKEMESLFVGSIAHNSALISLARSLSKRYLLALGSNNDHVTVAYLRKKHADILGIFSRVYFSNELLCGKPNLTFFRYIVRNLGKKPSECLFIDDKEENIAAAKRIGMRGIVFKSAAQLKKDLQRLKLL